MVNPLAGYNWSAENCRSFDSWEAEIEFAKNKGYVLVPADYQLPHWSDKVNGKDCRKVYVVRGSQIEELSTSHNCPASDVGYPLYFRACRFLNMVEETIATLSTEHHRLVVMRDDVFKAFEANRDHILLNLMPKFTRRMAAEVDANSAKGPWEEWTPTQLHLISEIGHHFAKFCLALDSGDKEKVTEYAADCANYFKRASDLWGVTA